MIELHEKSAAISVICGRKNFIFPLISLIAAD